MNNQEIIDLVRNLVIEASTSFRKDQLRAYKKALQREENEQAAWILDILIQNAILAHKNKVPLCDDTGIPHVLIEVGEKVSIPADLFGNIKEGIKLGLRELPGRPMGVVGDDVERIEQSQGLKPDPGSVVPASYLIDCTDFDGIKIHLIMLGGGPEIRARTYKVFHQRDYRKVFEEVVTWMKSELPMLGCTPCIPAIGVGRTHFEASSLMLKAMAYGNLDKQSQIEREITRSANNTNIGPLGIGGSTTALGSFLNIGPQRASGVRILSMRLCCAVEPRRSLLYLPSNFLG